MTTVEPPPMEPTEPTIRHGRAWFIEDVDLEMKQVGESRHMNSTISNLLVGVVDEKDREKIIKDQEKIYRLRENVILKRYGKPEKPIKADDPEEPKDPKDIKPK